MASGAPPAAAIRRGDLRLVDLGVGAAVSDSDERRAAGDPAVPQHRQKEPAWWKRALANLVFRRADVLVVHAKSEGEEARRRTRATVVETFLPVHELGREIPSRAEARQRLGVEGNVALLFGHIRPFKGLDIALEAWRKLQTKALLIVAGEPWWGCSIAR